MNEGMPKKSLLGKMREHGKHIRAGLGLVVGVGGGITAEAQSQQQKKLDSIASAVKQKNFQEFAKQRMNAEDFEKFKKEDEEGFKKFSEEQRKFDSTENAKRTNFDAFPKKIKEQEEEKRKSGNINPKEGPPKVALQEVSGEGLKDALDGYESASKENNLKHILKQYGEGSTYKIIKVTKRIELAESIANSELRSIGITEANATIFSFFKTMEDGRLSVVKVVVEGK